MRHVSIADVIDANRLLEERSIPCKVHLRDACGRQTCWIEPLGSAGEADAARAREALRSLFAEKRLRLEFDEGTGRNFWVAG